MLSNTMVPYEYGRFREAVLAGEILVNEYVSLQMNLIDDLIESPDFYYDPGAIDGFIEFCENELTLTDGNDLYLLPSFRLWAEDLLSWFYFVEEEVYNPELGKFELRTVKKRLRNKQYLIVARGAAKSVYAACLQAYFLVIDTDTTHQIITAPTMKQSAETTQPIETAIIRSRGPLFKALTAGSLQNTTGDRNLRPKLLSTKLGIENKLTNSLIEVRPMSVHKLQGLRSKYNTVDEWLSGNLKEDVIEALEQGASKLDDYIIAAISSEGTVRNGIGDTIKMTLKERLQGVVYDPHTSIWHYKLDSLDEINDPKMWVKAQPNIGATVSYETYKKAIATAEAEPHKRNDIIAKRFGIPLEGHTYFFTYEETIPYELKHKDPYDGMVCAMGADLSKGDDFCAFTFLFPLRDGNYGIKTKAYISDYKYRRLPSATMLKYDEMIAEGSLVVLENDGYIDMMEVYDDLETYIMTHDYSVLAFGFDPYNSKEFVQRWVRENSEFGVEKVAQGVRTESVPLGELKALSLQKRLIFDEVLMQFSMSHAIVLEDNNGNLKLSKMRDEEKIDNVSALMDAWVAYKLNQEAFE